MANLDAPDIFRIYDAGIKTWITNNIKNGSETIPVVLATPEKVFAEMTRLQGQGSKLRPILPFITITRVSSERDATRYNISDIPKVAQLDAELQDSAIATKYPVPVNISYQFDVWMNFKDHENKAKQSFMLALNHPCYVEFTIDKYIKDKICYFTLESQTDTSSLEPAVEENRIFRNTYNCNLNAWLYYSYHEQKLVNTYTIDVHSVTSQGADVDNIVEDDWTLEKILLGS